MGSPGGQMEYTKEYEYDEKLIGDDARKAGRIPGVSSGAFSYEKSQSPTSDSISSPESYDKSPGIRKAKGRAFNYAPGDLDRVAEEAEKRQRALHELALGGSGTNLDQPGPVQTSTPQSQSQYITTPEKDKGFDVENFGNENKFLSDSIKQQQQGQLNPNINQQQTSPMSKLQQEQRTPSPHLYAPRPWSAASSVSGSGYRPGGETANSSNILEQLNRGDSGATSPVGGDGRKTPSKRVVSSIFSQPGYTTSFLNKPVSPSSGSESGMGYQNKMFQESPTHRQFATSTPVNNNKPSSPGEGGPTPLPRGDNTFSYATPARPFKEQSESMITHPGGGANSQMRSPTYGGRGSGAEDISSPSSPQQQNVTIESMDSISSSESDDTSLHSSSSSDYEENKVPSTDELQEPSDLRRRGSSRRKKGKKGSFNKGTISTTPQIAGVTPKIVKTTTKATIVKDSEGIRQDVHERVEDLGTGTVTVSSTSNQVCFYYDLVLRGKKSAMI